MGSAQDLFSSSSFPELSVLPSGDLFTKLQPKVSRSCQILPGRIRSPRFNAIGSDKEYFLSDRKILSQKSAQPRDSSDVTLEEGSSIFYNANEAVMFRVSRLRPFQLQSTEELFTNGNGTSSKEERPSFLDKKYTSVLEKNNSYLRPPDKKKELQEDEVSFRRNYHSRSRSSFASDEGFFSARSSILKSSSLVSEYGRRSSWAPGNHRLSKRSLSQPFYPSSPRPAIIGPSLVSLRTYYAFGAKSMPAMDKWAKRIPSYSGNKLQTPLRTEIYSSYGLSRTSSTVVRGNSISHLPGNRRYSGPVVPDLDTFKSFRKGAWNSDAEPSIPTGRSEHGSTNATIQKEATELQKLAFKDRLPTKTPDVSSETVGTGFLDPSVSDLISKLQAENKQLKRKIGDQADELTTVGTEKTRMEQKCADLENKVRQKDAQIADLHRNNSKLSSENNQLKQAHANSDQTKIERLENRILYLESLLGDKEKTEKYLRHQLETLQLEHEHQRLLAQDLNGNGRRPSEEEPELPNPLCEVNAEISSLYAIRRKMEGDLISLQTEMENALLELKEREERK